MNRSDAPTRVKNAPVMKVISSLLIKSALLPIASAQDTGMLEKKDVV